MILDLSLEELFEVFLPFLSSFSLGFFLIFVGYVLKNKYISKLESATDAKVLKVEKDPTLDGRYLIYLEYLYFGRVITGIYKSYVKYYEDSTVKILLYGDKPGDILSDVPTDIDEDERAVNVRFYQVVLFIGRVILVFSILGVLTNLYDYTEESIYLILLLTVLFGIFVKFIYSSKKKVLNELELLKTNKYEIIKTRVIGFKTGHKLFRSKPIQFPVVEFEYNGKKIEKLLKEDVIINNFNDKENGVILVFRNIETGKIFSESSLKDKEDIYNTILIISAIAYVICIILT